MDMDVDVGYADVSSFEPASDIEVIKDIEILTDADISLPYLTGFTLDVYKDIEPELDFEMASAVEAEFVLDQTPYQVEFSRAYMNIIYARPFSPNDAIEMILNEQHILDIELVDAINALPIDPTDVEVVLLELEIEAELSYLMPFEFTLENEMFDVEIEYESINAIGFEITAETRNIDLGSEFELITALGFDVDIRYINDFNVNIGFYTPIVLELKTSNIQVNIMDLNMAMEVADYITHFYDMDGWIVEDDLTGKKFRDLR